MQIQLLIILINKFLLRTSVLISFLLIVCNPCFSQKYRLGLKGGGIVAWMKPDVEGVDVEKYKFGYVYGAMGEYLFADNYLFSLDINVTQRGGGIEDSRKDTLKKISYQLQYLEIPLTIKMKTNQLNNMAYFGKFGICPAFNLKSRKDISEIFAGNTLTNSDLTADADIRKIGAALVIGFGTEYFIGETTTLVGELVLNKGFTNVAKTDGLKMNNSYVALNIGIIF